MNLIDFKHLLLVVLIFVPLERVFALRTGQKILRPGWVVDLTHLLASGLLIKLGLGITLAAMIAGSERLVSAYTRASVGGEA